LLVRLQKWREELARKELIAQELRDEQKRREGIFLSVYAKDDICKIISFHIELICIFVL
jgi:hypothetical protein